MDVNAKGAGFEREIARSLKDHGYPDARRTAQVCGDHNGVPDVDGLPGMHLECKRQEKMRLYQWYAQAVRDSGYHGTIPLVVHRESRKNTLATMSWDDFLRIIKAAYENHPDGKFPPA